MIENHLLCKVNPCNDFGWCHYSHCGVTDRTVGPLSKGIHGRTGLLTRPSETDVDGADVEKKGGMAFTRQAFTIEL